MPFKISTAPCCWGVDDPKNPYLPPWTRVLAEAAEAGYRGIELGPHGYLPGDIPLVKSELEKNGLTVTAGTIFDDLVSAANFANLRKQVDDICAMLTALPRAEHADGQRFSAPYLVIIDWGHDERDYAAGHDDAAPRLSHSGWKRLISHIKQLSARAFETYGIRPVVHPHAGGYIEFADEIETLIQDVEYKRCGLCLDTGHLYYSRMDPVVWLKMHAPLIDYVHFKDVDKAVYTKVMKEKIRFFDACARGVMCPIGEGAVPYLQIRDTLRETGYSGFITVEQERDPRQAGGSLEAVKKSLLFLQAQGF